MSRRRWIVLLGPPAAGRRAVPRLPSEPCLSPGVTPSVELRSIASCATATMPASRTVAAALPGTWWRAEPSIDASASLESWTLLVGAPGVPTGELRIAAASTVTGPVDGRVVVASEGTASEDGSTVRIVDALSGCATEIPIGQRIVRRAVADPVGSGVLAHLLEPETRRDLGRLADRHRRPDRRAHPRARARRYPGGGGHRPGLGHGPPPRCGATTPRRPVVPPRRMRHPHRRSRHRRPHRPRPRGPGARSSGSPAEGSSHGRPAMAFPARSSRGTSQADSRARLRPRPRARHSAGTAGSSSSSDADRPVNATWCRSTCGPECRAGWAPPAQDAIPLSGSAGMTAGLEVAGSSVPIGRDGRSPMPLVLEDAAGFAPPDREVQP